LGAKDPDRAEREGWRSNWSAISTMSVILLALFARPIADVFTDDAEVIELTIMVLTIFEFGHPLMAVEFAIGGVLRGAGDTVFPRISIF
jgi:Na+-driven multidrug efflux pump